MLETLGSRDRRTAEVYMRSICHRPKPATKQFPSWGCTPPYRYVREHERTVWLYEMFEKHQLSEKQIQYMWCTLYRDQSKRSAYMRATPVQERKDNKNVRNTSGGGGNFSSVRVPSKKHKNAWKKFKLLFPGVDVKAGRRVSV